MAQINTTLSGNGKVKNTVADLKVFGKHSGVIGIFDRMGFTALGKAIKNYKKSPEGAQVITELEKNLILRAVKMMGAYKSDEAAELLLKLASVNYISNKDMLIDALDGMIKTLGYRQAGKKHLLSEAKDRVAASKLNGRQEIAAQPIEGTKTAIGFGNI